MGRSGVHLDPPLPAPPFSGGGFPHAPPSGWGDDHLLTPHTRPSGLSGTHPLHWGGAVSSSTPHPRPLGARMPRPSRPPLTLPWDRGTQPLLRFVGAVRCHPRPRTRSPSHGRCSLDPAPK
ncbi:hypothetical protein PIB30_042598 [Stylosanthes scabra]|uniref:Uncharacterized protein n=1 Tax=Stylosanthes scabra TaxID=79078 RepID=A0ABU6UGK2_9FABA|nr:hypothetical protein [Stylosanthes scabra]